MAILWNVLWIVLGGGFLIALQYFLGGLLLCLTVVGIPFGLQCFKLAHLALFPFGKEVSEDPQAPMNGCLGFILTVFWWVFGGFTTFLSHLTLAFGLAITVIGIPFALQHFKLATLALFPFGRRIEIALS